MRLPFFILLILSNVFFAQNDLFSPANRLKFGNHLFAENDYLRAASEYKAYLTFEENDTTRFRFAWSLAKLDRFTEARDNYKSLFFDSKLGDEARFECLKLYYIENRFADLKENAARGLYSPVAYKDNIIRLIYVSELLASSVPLNREEFLLPFEGVYLETAASLYERKIYPQYKSPGKAALLSAFLPGAGKIYTGDTAEGITAFLANGLLAYLTYTNFDHDHHFRGWLFGSLTALFYGGNVYGSYTAAKHFNAHKKFELEEDIRRFAEENDYFAPDYGGLVK